MGRQWDREAQCMCWGALTKGYRGSSVGAGCARSRVHYWQGRLNKPHPILLFRFPAQNPILLHNCGGQRLSSNALTWQS